MAQNVKFIAVKLQSTFDALTTKDALTLYWIQDSRRLYKGAELYGVGLAATAEFSGLMSAEDKAKLDALVAGTSGLTGLAPVDGTISLTDTEDGGKAIRVAVSTQEGNVLVAADDGLFVPQSSVRLAETTHGLVAVDGALMLNLATNETDGAMSKEDKKTLDAIPTVYVAREYEISHKPEGTLVDYRDKEIRVMCPSDTEWTLQNSGEGSDASMYYIGFKAYAPEGAVSFKEDLAETITDDTMYYFEGNDFAGIDAYGRKYSIVWLPVANYDGSVWTYYGASSTTSKYIGWYYTVKWYNANGAMIDADQIRINLSNEACHITATPSYINEVITPSEAESIRKTVAAVEESYIWGTL